jgi:hypothetical protein
MDRDGGLSIQKRGGIPRDIPRGVQRGNNLCVLIQTHISEFYYHLGKNSNFWLSV